MKYCIFISVFFYLFSQLAFCQSEVVQEKPIVMVVLKQPTQHLQAWDDTLMIEVSIKNISHKTIKIPDKLDFYNHDKIFGALIVEVMKDGVPFEGLKKSNVFIRKRLGYFPSIKKIRPNKVYQFSSNFSKHIRLYHKGTYQVRVQLSVQDLRTKEISYIPPTYSNWITIVVDNDSNNERSRPVD